MLESPEIRRRTEGCFPFLSVLAPGLRQGLYGAALYTHIPRGRPIYHEGAQCTHLALVLSGAARVFKIAENGRDITLYRVESGQICILTASCILSDLPFPASAVCEQATEAVLLPGARVREWSACSEPFRDYLFGSMAQRLGNLITTVEEVAFRRLDQRLAAYLLERCPCGTLRLQATHQDIASDLGSSREVISRLLKDFEGRGLIRTGRGALQLLDAAGLERARRDSP